LNTDQCAHYREHMGPMTMDFGKRQPQFFDWRKAGRHTHNINATAITDGGARIGCVIVNYSTNGALLIVPSVLGMPPQFDLHAEDGLKRRVEIVRRGRAFLGVRFI